MKINFFLIIIILAATFGMTLYYDSQKARSISVVPDFDFQDLDEHTERLYDYRGKSPVIIHFWATWCPPCIVEFPEFIEAAHQTPDTIFLAVSVDYSKSDIMVYLNRQKWALPNNVKIVHDAKREITQTIFNVKMFPETFFLDKNMTIDRHVMGPYTGWVQ